MGLSLEEKKEWIVDSYRSSFDKESAYIKCGISIEEKELLEKDLEFQDRLKFYLIEEQERIFNILKDLSNNPKPEIALKATLAIGRMIYPNRFIEEDLKNLLNKPTEPIEFPKEPLEKDHGGRVLEILMQSGVFKSGIGKTPKTEIN